MQAPKYSVNNAVVTYTEALGNGGQVEELCVRNQQ